MLGKIPVIMCIDVEPDDFFIDRQNPVPWLGYEGSYDFFTELRPKLAAATHSPVNYLWSFRMDPQIAETYGSPGWAVSHYPRYVEEFLRHGDMLGVHPHAYRWDDELDSWIIDHGNQTWVDHCVTLSFECYRECLGMDCQSFRFGDGWINQETLCLVEQLGARFDLTLEPGQKSRPTAHIDKPYTGFIPDLGKIPRFPYRFCSDDFRQPAYRRENGLWLIPLSSGAIRVPRVRRWRGIPRFWRRCELQFQTLNVSFEPQWFQQTMNEILTTSSRPYLAFVVRTDVSTREVQFRNMHETFSRIMSHPLIERFVFSTPGDALNFLGYSSN